jgi:acid phosphatase
MRQDTLVLITFDENHSRTKQNRVLAILMGGAVPAKSHGTIDNNYYGAFPCYLIRVAQFQEEDTTNYLAADHYSEIATVEANWGLSTLGRFDVGANVFSLVANKTGDTVRTHPDISSVYLNESYPGVFSNVKKNWAPMPMPNASLEWNERKVLESVIKNSDGGSGKTYYSADLVIPDRARPPVYKNVTR